MIVERTGQDVFRVRARILSASRRILREIDEPENAAHFRGGNGRISSVQDLDGDGWSELIAHNDVLAYFDDLCYACSPGLTLVIGWDGRKFTDRTRRFPQFARRDAAEERVRFLKALPKDDPYAEDERRSPARAWLLARAPESTRRWLVAEEGNLRTALARTSRKICITPADSPRRLSLSEPSGLRGRLSLGLSAIGADP